MPCRAEKRSAFRYLAARRHARCLPHAERSRVVLWRNVLRFSALLLAALQSPARLAVAG